MAINGSTDTLELLIQATADFSSVEAAYKKSVTLTNQLQKELKTALGYEAEFVKARHKGSISARAEVTAAKELVRESKARFELEERNRISMLGQLKTASLLSSKLSNYRNSIVSSRDSGGLAQQQKEASYMSGGPSKTGIALGDQGQGTAALKEYYTQLEALQNAEFARTQKLETQFTQFQDVRNQARGATASYHKKEVALLANSNTELQATNKYYRDLERITSNIEKTRSGANAKSLSYFDKEKRSIIESTAALKQMNDQYRNRETLQNNFNKTLSSDRNPTISRRDADKYRNNSDINSGNSDTNKGDESYLALTKRLAEEERKSNLISKEKTALLKEQIRARLKGNELIKSTSALRAKLINQGAKEVKQVKSVTDVTEMNARAKRMEARAYDYANGTFDKSTAKRISDKRVSKELYAALNGETKALHNNTNARKINNKQPRQRQENLGTGGATSFAHKVYNTASYAAAGTGIYMVANAAKAGVTAIIDFDKAIRTMSAVLDVSIGGARELGQGLNDLGSKFGGTQKDIYGIALALGRAGVATDKLVKGTEIAIKMALLTGDTFEESSKAIISYQQVFGQDGMGNTVNSIESLGDKLAYVANVSRLSTQDIGTFSNYALAAAKSAGLTVDAVGAMAASFSNAGVNASTIGTQMRSLTKLFANQSTSVKGLFGNLGIVQKSLQQDLQKGGETSNRAIAAFSKQLAQLSDEDFANFTAGLNKLDANSLMLLRQQSDSFTKFLRTSVDGVEGQLEETSVIVASFATTWESTVNSLKDSTVDIFGPATTSAKNFFGMAASGLAGFNALAKDSGTSLSDIFTAGLTPVGTMYKGMEKLLGSSKQLEGSAKNHFELWQKKNQLMLLGQDLEASNSESEKARITVAMMLLSKELGIEEKITEQSSKKAKLRHIEIEFRKTYALYQDKEATIAKIIKDIDVAKVFSQEKVVAAKKLELKEAKSIRKIYGDTITDLKNQKDILLEIGAEKSKQSKTTPQAASIDTALFSQSIVSGAQARQDMTKYQAKLVELTKIQVGESSKEISNLVLQNKLVDENGKALDRKHKLSVKQEESILNIVDSSTTYKGTMESIAALQVLSVGEVGKYRNTIDKVIEQLQERLKLQLLEEQGAKAVNEENKRAYEEQVKKIRDSEEFFKIDEAASRGKITALEAQAQKLEQQRIILKEISAIDNSGKNAPTTDKQAEDALAQYKTVSKLKSALDTAYHNDRIKQEKTFYDNTLMIHSGYLTAKTALDKVDTYAPSTPTNTGKEYDIATAMQMVQIDKERLNYTSALDANAELSAKKKIEYLSAYDDAVLASRQKAYLDAMGKTDPITAEYDGKMTVLTEYYAAKYALATSDAERDIIAKQEQADRDQLAADARIAQVVRTADLSAKAFGDGASIIENLQSSGLVNSKKAFKTMQALQIAQAIASTYSTAVLAYQSAFTPPTIASPILGGISAAAAIAAGMANVAQIKAQTFHTGGMVGPTGNKLRSDEVPAILQTGEMVLNRNETQQMNAAPQTAGETVIVNSVDPGVLEEFMTSRPGRKIIRNIVDKG